GVLDDANAALDKLLARTYAALDKRLLHTAAVVAASGPLRLRVTLAPPGGSLPIAASETQAADLPAGFGIDVLWAGGDSARSKDGDVRLAGTNFAGVPAAGPDVHLVHVGWVIDDPIVVQGQPEVVEPGRWTVQIDQVPRGSYIVRVTAHGPDFGPYRAASLGL